MTHFDVLIVGSGHGGVSAASVLRHLGYSGSIGIVSADADEPYERPPLSKEYLAGTKDFASIHARGPNFWAEKQIEVMLGEEVIGVNAAGHNVTTASGRQIAYGKLVWAAGGAPRALTCDGGDLAGIHTIRTRADVDRLHSDLGSANRIVVIGGGYIGLEAAASLTKLGKHVSMLEALDRLLARVAAPQISDYFLALHRGYGVDIRLDATVTCIEGEDGRANRVLLSDGSTVDADLIIAGIGIAPNVAALKAAGADCSNGVAVDEYCRTSLPDVYALGDCALHRNLYGPDTAVRVESVQNAADQGSTAAHHIAGQPLPYAAVPWFWSNQYETKLQTVGLNAGFDETILRGDPKAGRFSLIYLRNGVVAALDCVNMVKDYVQGRNLVEARARVDRAELADPAIALKSLLTE